MEFSFIQSKEVLKKALLVSAVGLSLFFTYQAFNTETVQVYEPVPFPVDFKSSNIPNYKGWVMGMSLKRDSFINSNFSKQNQKEASIKLELKGVVSGKNAKVAMIAYKGVTKVYSVGDVIADNWTLDSVLNSHVVVSNDSKVHKVYFPENALMTSTPPNQVSSNVKKKLLEISNNPMGISQYVAFKHVNKGQYKGGYKLYPTKDKELFAALGFKPGDILTKADGESISELSKDIPALWRKIRSKNVELTVSRNNTDVSIRIEL